MANDRAIEWLEQNTTPGPPLPPINPLILAGEARRSGEAGIHHEDGNNESSTIYHLKTTIADSSFIHFSGPYASLEALGSQIKSFLSEAKNVRAARHTVTEIVSMLEEDPEWTIYGPSGRKMRFEVSKEENKAVKDVLPESVKKVYIVTSTKSIDGKVVDDKEVHGSIVKRKLARKRWEKVLDKYEAELGEEWELQAEFGERGGLAGGIVTEAHGYRFVQVKTGFEEIGGCTGCDGGDCGSQHGT